MQTQCMLFTLFCCCLYSNLLKVFNGKNSIQGSSITIFKNNMNIIQVVQIIFSFYSITLTIKLLLFIQVVQIIFSFYIVTLTMEIFLKIQVVQIIFPFFIVSLTMSLLLGIQVVQIIFLSVFLLSQWN